MSTRQKPLILAALFGTVTICAAELQTVEIPSPIDGVIQKARFRPADGDQPRPLLVALHTWSGDYTQSCETYAGEAEKRNWNFIFPDFRGANRTPEAMGSELAVADVVAAVEFAKQNTHVDADRIYLTGGSGGGHMTLLLVGRHPEIWAAAAAWCPIGDIARWHRQASPGYVRDIERCCGGNPQSNFAAMEQARKRSPVTWFARAADIPVDIGIGVNDTTVPPGHGLLVFNTAAAPVDRFTDEEIDYIESNKSMPLSFGERFIDPSFSSKIWLLARRISGKTRVTLFACGHVILVENALRFLELQKKGVPPVWAASAKDDRVEQLKN